LIQDFDGNGMPLLVQPVGTPPGIDAPGPGRSSRLDVKRLQPAWRRAAISRPHGNVMNFDQIPGKNALWLLHNWSNLDLAQTFPQQHRPGLRKEGG
jgi:hypothetical protein